MLPWAQYLGAYQANASNVSFRFVPFFVPFFPPYFSFTFLSFLIVFFFPPILVNHI